MDFEASTVEYIQIAGGHLLSLFAINCFYFHHQMLTQFLFWCVLLSINCFHEGKIVSLVPVLEVINIFLFLLALKKLLMF